MKKFLAIIALVTFSLSLSAAPGDGQKSYRLQPLEFSFDKETIGPINADLPEEEQVLLAALRGNLSSFVPCILSLHNRSKRKVGIRGLRIDLSRKLNLIDIASLYQEISAGKQKVVKVRVGLFGHNVATVALYLGGLALDGFFFYGLLSLSLISSICANLWKKGITSGRDELIKSKKEFIEQQILGFPEGTVPKFLQDVYEIAAGQEVCFFIVLPREGLGETQRQLDEILFRHGFLLQEDPDCVEDAGPEEVLTVVINSGDIADLV
jgi:hypothetical protein